MDVDGIGGIHGIDGIDGGIDNGINDDSERRVEGQQDGSGDAGEIVKVDGNSNSNSNVNGTQDSTGAAAAAAASDVGPFPDSARAGNDVSHASQALGSFLM
ncbi:MAG: hypothetical protein STHCBS139747_002247 [Sporothrix thermara]